MRLPLLQGMPFTGSATIVDLTTEADAHRARYVTLYAVNLEPSEGTVAASLVVDGDTIDLPETTLAATSLRPRWVLERFPIMGAASLNVVASSGVFCFGFVELEPSERSPRPELFAPTAPTPPLGSPNGVFGGDDEHVVHVVPDSAVQDVSLVLDAPAGAHFEMRFYRDNVLAASLALQGPLVTLEFLDHIPMQGPASVRMQIVEVADEDQRVSIYGNMVRR